MSRTTSSRSRGARYALMYDAVVETERSRSAPTVLSIQYLRALAASLIAMHHAMAVPELSAYYPRPFAQVGVDIFFVISGCIMWMTTVHGQRGPIAFWAARIARVVPIYWIYTTLFIAVSLAVPAAVFHGAIDPIHVLKSYLFIPALHPKENAIVPTYTLGWTLNFEMFFYLVFGFCLFISARLVRLVAMIGALALLVLFGKLVLPSGPVATTYTDPILLEFAAGVALGAMSGHLPRLHPALGWGLIVTGIIWFIGCYGTGAIQERLIGFGLPAAMLVAGGLVLEPMARKNPSPLGLLLGDASYSIYLAHPFAERVWYFVFIHLIGIYGLAGCVLFVGTSTVVGIAGGVASFVILERPIMRASRRLLRSISTSSAISRAVSSPSRGAP